MLDRISAELAARDARIAELEASTRGPLDLTKPGPDGSPSASGGYETTAVVGAGGHEGHRPAGAAATSADGSAAAASTGATGVDGPASPPAGTPA